MKPSLHILNLEDNPKDAELNAAMISARWPHNEFLCVDNRDDFLVALEQENLDLILSDYTMPNFNGLEALTLAHDRRPEVPFLFVSGTIGEDSAIEALKKGATDYVLKNRLLRLIPAVDRALRESEERAECEQAEELMRQSEYKYRVLFESLGDAAFLVDEETGKILDMNRRTSELLGFERGEILGHRQPHFLELDVAVAKSASPVEGSLICADGARVQVIVRNTRLKLHGRDLVLRLCHEYIVRV